MFEGWLIFLCVLGYLTLLFLLAYYAERRERAGRSIVANPYIYSLSLAVYCTAWTFYGSVGKAATSGLMFLTIYLGPTLMAVLWLFFMKKVIRIAKANRITTLSDFIGFRYGKSLFLSGLFTIVAVMGIIPYIGLQIKAIIHTMTIISGETAGSAAAGLFITAILGIFAVIFGARRLDASERHGGLVFAIAFESIIKLLAFVLIGLFVTYGLYDGFSDIFSRIRDSEHSHLLLLGTGPATAYSEWFALLFLSMIAIVLLPRQFQMAVVENYDESHINKAAWLLPLYLFLINIFVLPIAFGGLLSEGSAEMADYFVLTIPSTYIEEHLALIAFIGGFSAATAMVIVESLALSTMVMNSLIMPTMIKFHELRGFPTLVLNLKRAIILGVVYLGYLFAVSIGEYYGLVEIGLKSFELIAQFAPAFFLGLYWKRASKAGAAAGLIAGFIVWFYPLILPDLLRAGVIESSGLIHRMVTSEMLNPESLFGIKGLGKWGHSLLWGMLVNVSLFVGVSIFTRQSREEEIQALIVVDSYQMVPYPTRGSSYKADDIENILAMYLGRSEATEAIGMILSGKKKAKDELNQKEVFELRTEAERVLAGAVGSSIAAIIFETKLILTEKEREDLSRTVKDMTENLQLSRRQLAEANRELSYLKAFSENIIESAPIGIATVDAHLRIKYWNNELESITGFKRAEAFNRPITYLLDWLERDVFSLAGQREIIVQAPAQQSFKINISPFKDPSGGFVVIIENVTERKIMAEQLLEASKLASIGKLTAGISHEIGNPLASISSLVQELRSLKMDSAEEIDFTNDSLKVVNTHIERMVNIVRNLGDFARTSAAEKTASSLPDILDRTIKLVKYDKRFKNIQLATVLEADIPQLMLNQDKIQQVFLNLIINALDAMPEGGSLNINMRSVDSVVEISFSDTGAGIDEAVLDRIFDPFFSTKTQGKGTGLGLSICYGIIREHNGTITVKSREGEGEGTTFLIRLPIENMRMGVTA
ncbi:MAG: ATP-binding protein [Smithellaceae bacterium]|nr:ATP-binding protein [Smithellaceae bacterium]